MTGIYYIDVRLFENENLFEKCMSLISEKRWEYIRNLKNPVAARLSLGAGILERIVLEKNGYDTKDIRYTVQGKPYLDADFHFNLSHSGNFVTFVHSDIPAGIDLQKIKKDIPKYTARILTEDEAALLQTLPDTDKREMFYRIWTRKESLIKWDGRGLRIPLQNISAANTNGLCDKTLFEKKELYWKEEALLLPEYALCVCCEGELVINEIIEITAQFLTKY